MAAGKTLWSDISASGLIPHVEEAAIMVSFRNFVMPNIVRVATDMTGWNTRKVSEYLRARRAQNLDEATDIPATQVLRVRKTEISPYEVGDRYPISDRRADTDLENILADAASFLGNGIGARRERDLINVALAGFSGGNISGGGAVFDWKKAVEANYEFQNRALEAGNLFVVVHPFGARDVMKDLVTFSQTSGGQSVPAFRDTNISAWTVPAFQNTTIVVSPFVPRTITYNLDVSGITDAQTFRLEVLTDREVNKTITAAITKSGTPATTVANVKAALEALTFTGNGTWTVTGAANNAIAITPPVALDAEEELRAARDPLTGALYTNGADVVITETTATAKALMFYRDALLLDVRKPLRVYSEEVNQGRVLELSSYETFGTATWRDEMGMTYTHLCKSAFATG